MNKFYLYRHIRSDINVPFYIGIGTKRNLNFEKKESEYERAFAFNLTSISKFWKKTFEKCNKQIEVDILYESDSLDEIKDKEKEFIKLYGRRDLGLGTLVNLTDGGEGVLGKSPSPETLEKLRLSHLGYNPSEEHRKKISIANTGLRIYFDKKKGK